ncbi:Holliday junction branch migration DNA helicase RuvB [Candidatus Berkelbacteria bacterium]|nr:Holliday junction branch migration DNA helicase RuvB [Candidatus Berkelbacteria bacterium]
MSSGDEEGRTTVLTEAVQSPSEVQDDLALRPTTLDDFIGQVSTKRNLVILIEAAKGRGQPLEHTLFYGPPGLGKTSLSCVVANELGAQIRITSGPALERAGDLASILTGLKRGDILFIDEIHRLNRTIEEMLYPAMEDFSLDLIMGKGPSAKTLRLELEQFTLIAATTQIGKLSSPLRDRFGAHFQLDFYEDQDIQKIIERNAQPLGVKITPEGAEEIAKRARKTPRIANRLLRRVRDYAQVKKFSQITAIVADKALNLLHIDNYGLNKADRKLLRTIIDQFAGGPVGLGTIAAILGEDPGTVEEVYEPFLMQVGFLERTNRGRTVTAKAAMALAADV